MRVLDVDYRAFRMPGVRMVLLQAWFRLAAWWLRSDHWLRYPQMNWPGCPNCVMELWLVFDLLRYCR